MPGKRSGLGRSEYSWRTNSPWIEPVHRDHRGVLAALGPGLTTAMIPVGVIFSPIMTGLLRDGLDPIASAQRRRRPRLKGEGSLAGSGLPDEIDPLLAAPDSTFPDRPTALG